MGPGWGAWPAGSVAAAPPGVPGGFPAAAAGMGPGWGTWPAASVVVAPPGVPGGGPAAAAGQLCSVCHAAPCRVKKCVLRVLAMFLVAHASQELRAECTRSAAWLAVLRGRRLARRRSRLLLVQERCAHSATGAHAHKSECCGAPAWKPVLGGGCVLRFDTACGRCAAGGPPGAPVGVVAAPVPGMPRRAPAPPLPTAWPGGAPACSMCHAHPCRPGRFVTARVGAS